MHGMFRGNGGCGYVKKPDFLMDEDHVFDPKAKLPVKTTLKVNQPLESSHLSSSLVAVIWTREDSAMINFLSAK